LLTSESRANYRTTRITGVNHLSSQSGPIVDTRYHTTALGMKLRDTNGGYIVQNSMIMDYLLVTRTFLSTDGLSKFWRGRGGGGSNKVVSY